MHLRKVHIQLTTKERAFCIISNFKIAERNGMSRYFSQIVILHTSKIIWVIFGISGHISNQTELYRLSEHQWHSTNTCIQMFIILNSRFYRSYTHRWYWTCHAFSSKGFIWDGQIMTWNALIVENHTWYEFYLGFYIMKPQ